MCFRNWRYQRGVGVEEQGEACIFLFIWLHRVLVTAGKLLSCGMHVGSSSLTRDRTWPPAGGAWSLMHCITREVLGEACFKGTCRGPCSCLPEPFRKGVLNAARLWSLPGASSRCGTLQILITHSQGALSRLGVGMARGRQDGLGLWCRHWFKNPISGYPQKWGHMNSICLIHHDCPEKHSRGEGSRRLGVRDL